MGSGDWIAPIRSSRSVLDVAASLGRSVRGQRFGPCPACAVEATGHRDRRPPVGVARNGEGWRCFACDASGDVVDVAALVLEGAALSDLDPDRRARVRAWFEGGSTFAPVAPRCAPVAPVAPAPVYPPPGDVAALWGACVPLSEARGADELRRWLRDVRGIDWRVLEGLDVLRATPADGWPEWCSNVARHASVYRFAMPLYDAAGCVRSLRFRALTARRVPASTGDRLEWSPVDAPIGKGTAAAGYSTKGLILADPWGAALLAGTLPVDAWTGEVWILEGEPDLWWALSAERPEPGTPRGALLSIPGSGSWTAELAARIPDGAVVKVATDNDEAGDKYAQIVYADLAHRCTVYRARPRSE